jgi:hypothetical protein
MATYSGGVPALDARRVRHHSPAAGELRGEWELLASLLTIGEAPFLNVVHQ